MLLVPSVMSAILIMLPTYTMPVATLATLLNVVLRRPSFVPAALNCGVLGGPPSGFTMGMPRRVGQPAMT